jgi:hypothetical protein
MLTGLNINPLLAIKTNGMRWLNIQRNVKLQSSLLAEL